MPLSFVHLQPSQKSSDSGKTIPSLYTVEPAKQIDYIRENHNFFKYERLSDLYDADGLMISLTNEEQALFTYLTDCLDCEASLKACGKWVYDKLNGKDGREIDLLVDPTP